MKTRRSKCARRGTVLYMTVLSSALIVSLLGIAGLTMVRLERRQLLIDADRGTARMNANSAVELALSDIANNSNWRSSYTNGEETVPLTTGSDATGTLSWLLEDSDGSLTNEDVELRLHGVGRAGNTVQVSSVQLAANTEDHGPAELRSMTSTDSQAMDEVLDDMHWCQYLKPTLPPEATAWWITRVEFYCQRDRDNRTFDIRIYEPEPTNWPSINVHDEISIESNSIDSSPSWHAFDFSGQYSLSPSEGVCIAVMTDSNLAPIKIGYRNGGVVEFDSALILGNPDWNSYHTDQALLYRVHGVYQTVNGMMTVPGTWVWDEAPEP